MSVYQELGTKLKNFISAKTEEVDDKVEAIDKHERYVNTELDYCHLELNVETPTSIAYDTIIPFNKFKNGNMEYNIENCSVKLKAGKTYEISVDYVVGQGMVNNILYDITNQLYIGNFIKNSSKTDIDLSSTSGAIIYTPETDCEIQVKASWISCETCILDTNNPYGYFIVKEVNRQIVIDPVEHVNESQGIEDTPVGHIIAHMGTVAPKHYLICDGTEYNIADYPYLAQHIEDNFGTINFFGGDGETTFAVPDLRGEFLRGTGTAERSTGSGAEVGEHQDPTQHALIDPGNGTSFVAGGSSPINKNMDTSSGNSTMRATTNTKSGGEYAQWFTSRPTNTSVLYCIKYQITQNNISKDIVNYSLEEQVIGSWIDGKPLYRKTFINKTIYASSGWTSWIDVSELNIDRLSFTIVDLNFNQRNSDWIQDLGSLAQYLSIAYNDTSKYIEHYVSRSGTYYDFGFITIQYTKTTDAENSFTPDMLSNISTLNTTASDEEVNEVIGGI